MPLYLVIQFCKWLLYTSTIPSFGRQVVEKSAAYFSNSIFVNGYHAAIPVWASGVEKRHFVFVILFLSVAILRHHPRLDKPAEKVLFD